MTETTENYTPDPEVDPTSNVKWTAEFMTEPKNEEDLYDLNSVEFDKFLNKTSELHLLYQKKNHDYGNSYTNLLNEFGVVAACMHLQEKVDRLKSLSKSTNLVPESIEDTLKDMANYAILTLMWLDNDIPSNTKSGDPT